MVSSWGGGAAPPRVDTSPGDGLPDLLAADQVGNAVTVALNLGERGFGQATSLSVGTRPTIVAAGDFNGDGAYDLVGVGASTTILTNAIAGRPRPGDGNGDGRISAADVALLARALALRPRWRVEDLQHALPPAASGADANGDGAVDASDLKCTLGSLFRHA